MRALTAGLVLSLAGCQCGVGTVLPDGGRASGGGLGGTGGANGTGGGSRATKGLRFQMCQPNLYGTVFQAVAQGVIASAQVACDFAVPAPPQGISLSNRISVAYTPGAGGAPTEFSQVANSGACASNSFSVQNGRVIFCPQTCSSVRMDAMARVAVRFTCEPMIQ